jgi:hypothetical protein
MKYVMSENLGSVGPSPTRSVCPTGVREICLNVAGEIDVMPIWSGVSTNVMALRDRERPND